MILVLLPVVGL